MDVTVVVEIYLGIADLTPIVSLVTHSFSNLRYQTVQRPPSRVVNGTAAGPAFVLAARPASSSFLSSSALLTGTALGSGLLTLPAAISPAGYLPSLAATLVAWAYMTISALLTGELLINRCGETGKVRNVGLLELYVSHLGPVGGTAAGIAFLILSYVMMGVYLSEGGDGLGRIVDALHSDGALDGMPVSADPSLPRAAFAAAMGTFLFAASKFGVVQRAMTHVFVPTTLLAFVLSMSLAFPRADFGSLVDVSNQHPEVVLNAFPLLFMSWTYHGVVPRVVYDLEGDKTEITKAIVAGSTAALILYLTWNAVVLGNVPADLSSDDPIAAVADPALRTSFAVVAELATATSLVGLVLGFVNEFYDAIGAPPSRSYGPKVDDKWKLALLTLSPPAVVSCVIGYALPSTDAFPSDLRIVDYAGAFGASALFLVLPALMAWKNRYGDDARPITVKPMVPFGKLALGSLYKAAGTLIVEQGLEKLGAFDFLREHMMHSAGAS